MPDSATPRSRPKAPVGQRARQAARRRVGAMLQRSGLDRKVRASLRDAPDVVHAGMVELFKPPWVEGWIAVMPKSRPVPVTLRLNGHDIVTTWPGDGVDRRVPGREVRRFRFAVNDLWDFVDQTDRIRVVSDDQELPIVGHGTVYRPTSAGPHRPKDLLARLAAGEVFSRTGRLQLNKQLDVEWQRLTLIQAERVQRFMAENFAQDAFLIYGSLLGAIREGGFIGHDSDLDLSYVSQHTDGREAAKELRDIAFALIDAGFRVRSYRTHLRIANTIEGVEDIHVDLFHTWFDDRDILRFPYGVAGVGRVHRSDWQGVRPVDFAGSTLLLPVCAEKIAEVLYGVGWRQPQPGFNWDRDRKSRGKAAMLPRPMVEEVYWADFYAHAEVKEPSTFFAAVNGRDDLPATVVDIGCGDGRDAFAHAAAGRHVTGIDRSHIAIRHATEQTVKLGLDDRMNFVTGDVSDAAEITGILQAARAAGGDGPILVYLRFFLHSLPEETQETLLDTIHAEGRPGDMFAAEFRTLADKEAPKVHTAHFRRYQDGSEFGETLRERYGYDVLEEQEGTGFAPYGDEDPHLYRVIARRR